MHFENQRCTESIALTNWKLPGVILRYAASLWDFVFLKPSPAAANRDPSISPGEPAVTALCHCKDCQKHSGGAYSTNAVVKDDQFKITSGTPKSYDAIGDSGKVNKHFFCGNCGSSLFNKLDVMEGMMVIKAGGLDGGKADLKDVAVEYYAKDRVSFVKEVAGAKQEQMLG